MDCSKSKILTGAAALELRHMQGRGKEKKTHQVVPLKLGVSVITQARFTFFLAEKIKIKSGCDMWSSPVKSSSWFICKQKAINEILRLHPTYRCTQPIG